MTRTDNSSRYPDIWKKYTPVQTLLRYVCYMIAVFIAFYFSFLFYI